MLNNLLNFPISPPPVTFYLKEWSHQSSSGASHKYVSHPCCLSFSQPPSPTANLSAVHAARQPKCTWRHFPGGPVAKTRACIQEAALQSRVGELDLTCAAKTRHSQIR